MITESTARFPPPARNPVRKPKENKHFLLRQWCSSAHPRLCCCANTGKLTVSTKYPKTLGKINVLSTCIKWQEKKQTRGRRRPLAVANVYILGFSENLVKRCKNQRFALTKKLSTWKSYGYQKTFKTLVNAWFAATCLWCEEHSPRSASSTRPLDSDEIR